MFRQRVEQASWGRENLERKWKIIRDRFPSPAQNLFQILSEVRPKRATRSQQISVLYLYPKKQ